MAGASIQERARFFRENGFVGPITLYEPDEARDMLREIRARKHDRSRLLHRDHIDYDRHFDIAPISRHVSHPCLIALLREIQGRDILLWRTEFTPAFPGAAGSAWHQGKCCARVRGHRQIVPTGTEWHGAIDIAVWTALTNADRETGCVSIARGSHDERTAAAVAPGDDAARAPAGDIVDLELAAGQAVVFAAGCRHRTQPNVSRRRTRYALTARYVPAHVRIYPDGRAFTADGGDLDLSHYGGVLVAGRDRYGHNRLRSVNNLDQPFLCAA